MTSIRHRWFSIVIYWISHHLKKEVVSCLSLVAQRKSQLGPELCWQDFEISLCPFYKHREGRDYMTQGNIPGSERSFSRMNQVSVLECCRCSMELTRSRKGDPVLWTLYDHKTILQKQLFIWIYPQITAYTQKNPLVNLRLDFFFNFSLHASQP